jgi:hypothetical protein
MFEITQNNVRLRSNAKRDGKVTWADNVVSGGKGQVVSVSEICTVSVDAHIVM